MHGPLNVKHHKQVTGDYKLQTRLRETEITFCNSSDAWNARHFGCKISFAWTQNFKNQYSH